MLAGYIKVTGLRSLGLLGQDVIHLFVLLALGHAPCLQSHPEGTGERCLQQEQLPRWL